MDKLLFGKSDLRRLVGLEVKDATAEVFIQNQDGTISSTFVPNKYWILSHYPINSNFAKLSGDLHYKYGIQFGEHEEFLKWRRVWKTEDIFSIYNPEESLMVKNGITFYRDLKQKDVSVLSFDLETTGLDGFAKDAKVLLISTTYRDSFGNVTNKLLAYDDYETEGELITAFCDYVRELNPSLVIGHNIIGYDFVYLKARADINGVSLSLGRDGSQAKFAEYESKFRLDGTRDLMYKNVSIYGREIVDCWLLAVSFDVSKSIESYALKPMIKQLGFEKQGRQYYDAGSIRNNYKNPTEWEKIKKYAEEDAEDALKLWDYMGSSYFYSANNIPRPFTELMLSATGAKINSMLLRAYIQDGHSVPKSNEIKDKIEGGVSFGVPGVYDNVVKWDIKSCYPSQILRFKLHDKQKDPKAYFYHIVKYFTEKRFEYKKLAKDTKDQHWIDMDSTAKLFINSAYGVLGTPGLNFNSPENAARITYESRKIIDQALRFVSGSGADHYMRLYGNKTFDENIQDSE